MDASTGYGPFVVSSFIRMDQGNAEHFAVIAREIREHQGRVPERTLAMLRSLAEIIDRFSVDQLTHSLQTATLAERADADEEMVFASLLHDVGKAVSVPNHPEIAAAIIKPYVRADVYFVIRAHQDFQGLHYYEHFDADPHARDQYRDAPWFDLAERFADEWDQIAFDPGYDTLPLEHFEPLVRERMARARGF
jgi:predicted HD phosphohydrolase